MRTISHHRFSILAVLFFILPALASAATLININTAGLTELETLPHIGATLGQRIIDYRTANGPFTSIQGLQKVSGIGSGVTYADIAPLITVGDATTSNTTDTTTAATATSTEQSSANFSRSASVYVPPPSALTVDAGTDRVAFIEVPLTFTAVVKAKSSVDPSARVRWSFGDGSSGEGILVEKTYRYAGTYLVVVTATDGPTVASDDFTVVVQPVTVRIASVSSEGITLANDSSERLDLSGWRLIAGTGMFRIPEGMTILPKANVLFPFAVVNLPIAFDAVLEYPNGIIATRYAPVLSSVPQPFPTASSSQQVQTPVQTVDPVITIRTKNPTQSYAEAVNAPAVATQVAAAGAAFASSSLITPLPTTTSHTSLLRSPWTLGLGGIIALAAGAFILL